MLRLYDGLRITSLTNGAAKMEAYMQKSEIRSIPLTSCKNQLKIDLKKTLNLR